MSAVRRLFSFAVVRQIKLYLNVVRAIPHNSKCRYGERGAAAAKPKAQAIPLCIDEHFGNADAVPQPPERCLSRQAGIVRLPQAVRKTAIPQNIAQEGCGSYNFLFHLFSFSFL